MKIKKWEKFNEDINHHDYNKGEIVMVNPKNDNENYDDFRNIPLKIIHVATNKYEHPGFISSMVGEGLYDLEDVKTGELINSSLYDYELVPYLEPNQ